MLELLFIIHFRYIVNHFWRAKGWNQEGLPTTDKLSSQIVSLPIDPFLSDKEQNKVIETVKKFFEEN